MANQEIRDVVFNLQVRTEDGKVKIEGLTKGFVKAETAFKKMKSTLDDTNDALNNTGISSGLANTAVLEFGRTISDAPYGIQGMGNNITQLVTILGQMSQSAKEGTSVIASLRKAMVGPLGIVIAIQIAVAAFEIFRKSQKDAKEETEALTVAIAKSALDLKIAVSVLDSENVSLERKNEVLAELSKKYPEWNLQHSKTGEISDTNVEKIKGEIKALETLAKAKALQSTLEKFYAERATMLAERELEKSEGDNQGFFSRVTTRFNRFLASTGFYGSEMEQREFEASLNDVDTKINAIVGEFEKEPALLTSLIGGDKKGKVTKDSRKKVKKLILEVYGLAAQEAVKAREKQQKLMKELGIDIPSMLMGGEEGKEAFKEGLASLYKEVEDVPIDYSGVGTSFNEILETMAPAFAEIGNFFSAEADRAIAIEENKTNRINDQLKKRLANEQLSADERDKINQQIAKNEAKLVEKENAINKKRFEQEKAFGIVQATVNTYLAASDVLAREKMGAVGKAIAVAAVITSGLAQVAAISRQQFTAKAMPTPNLTGQGGAGGSLGAPDFNVVGASQQSQIAEAIAGTRNEPLKAYVVSSDVTSAQELDRKILEGASI